MGEVSDIQAFPAQIPVDALAETLVAMANSRGGTLRFVLGDTPAEDLIDRLREASLRADPRLILPLPEVVDSTSVVVTVPQGLPHVFSLEGRYLSREGSTNRPLSPPELRRLLIERGDFSYE